MGDDAKAGPVARDEEPAVDLAAAEDAPAAPPPAPAQTKKRGKYRGNRRAWHRRLRHFLRPIFVRPLLAVALWLVPRIYIAYMWLVWKTSRVEDVRVQEIHEIRRAHDGVVCVLWHEEVFSVAWGYRDFAPHTLASQGDAGELITRMLQLCGYVVFRGGSTGHSSRRNETVLLNMINHMKTTPNVLYGITVDGSKGPRYRLKRGAIAIARECRKPICCVRTWARRRVHLKTWDRMAIPLPFNRIKRYMSGPFHVPPEADTPEGFEAFRAKIEAELNALKELSERDLGAKAPA